MPIKREIIYPIFLECIQYCTDNFWENVFEELAYGKTPSGTYINKGFLCCSFKDKEFSYKIERKEPNILYDDIYKLLNEKLGILSGKERIQKKIAFYELEKSIKESRSDWSSIRKKNIKDILYGKYVVDMGKKYNLSQPQMRQLFSLILLSMMFKTITSKDVEYDNGRIINIDGIEFEEGKIDLKRSLCNKVDISNNVIENKVKIMSDNWTKYLKEIRSLAK